MIQLHYVAKVEEGKCTGCRLCEKICPAGAIIMSDHKAAVNDERCIDCQRCIDCCSRENAILRLSRPGAVLRFVDHRDLDQAEIKRLCDQAGVHPDLPICGCNHILGREAAAAVLKGAKNPEDLCAMTGARAGCGIYCMTRLFQVLKGGRIDLDDPKDRRWIQLTLSLSDLSEDVIAKLDKAYPYHYLEEDWNQRMRRKSVLSKTKGESHV
jgi:Fe-S-cluster-containing hydrogenase component 2